MLLDISSLNDHGRDCAIRSSLGPPFDPLGCSSGRDPRSRRPAVSTSSNLRINHFLLPAQTICQPSVAIEMLAILWEEMNSLHCVAKYQPVDQQESVIEERTPLASCQQARNCSTCLVPFLNPTPSSSSPSSLFLPFNDSTPRSLKLPPLLVAHSFSSLSLCRSRPCTCGWSAAGAVPITPTGPATPAPRRHLPPRPEGLLQYTLVRPPPPLSPCQRAQPWPPKSHLQRWSALTHRRRRTQVDRNLPQ